MTTYILHTEQGIATYKGRYLGFKTPEQANAFGLRLGLEHTIIEMAVTNGRLFWLRPILWKDTL